MPDDKESPMATTRAINPIRGPIRGPIPNPVIPSGPASTQLPPANLGGAVGGDWSTVLNELVFVEYGGNLSRMVLSPSPGYAVLGTGYTTPEDVKVSADGKTAYVTERTGDLVKVSLSSPGRAGATVLATGMTAPQQLFLDEANNAAYTVEYAAGGRLWRIDLASLAKTEILSGLQNAVGVVLSADRQFAFISEQLAGGTGRVSRFQLSNGARQDVVTGLVAPFFLTWLDASQTTLLMPERDPANRLRSINVLAGTSAIVAQNLPARPSSVAIVTPGVVLVCCNDVIDEIFLAPQGNQPGGDLLEGIGWVPASWVDQATGLADTISHDPSYTYQVENAPFGGTLPVMVNFAEASALAARYYRVMVDGNVRTDVFHGAVNGVPATNSPIAIGSNPGYYPVFTAAQAEQWLPSLPGCYLDSTNLTSGQLHTITVDFYDATGVTVLASATPLKVYVDNNPCTAVLTAATFNGNPATACGYLSYTTATQNENVEIPFLAAQPEGRATYSVSLYRGVTPITGALSGTTSGAVTSAWADLSATAQGLLTYQPNTPPCTTAAFAAYLYVAATAQTGWWRCSELDASAAEAFMLVPTP
jgi:hypothetical protein